jgi:hypothetical protein
VLQGHHILASVPPRNLADNPQPKCFNSTYNKIGITSGLKGPETIRDMSESERPCQRSSHQRARPVSIRKVHTSAYVSIRQHVDMSESESPCQRSSHQIARPVSLRQYTSAYVSIRQHTELEHQAREASRVSIRQHTSAYLL